MPNTASPSRSALPGDVEAPSASRAARLGAIAAITGGALLLLAGAGLWAVYGGHVFLETVLSGLALCF